MKEYAVGLAASGLAPNTVRLGVAPVRALLATAVDEGLLRWNPAAGLRLAQRVYAHRDGDDERVKALSEDELVALLAAIEAKFPDWKTFFAVLAWSGMRIGEILELRWSDIDLGSRSVNVRRRLHNGRVGPPKSRYGRRRLRLTPELARALWRHHAHGHALPDGHHDDLVFRNSAGGWLDASNLMRRVLKPAAVEAGLGEWVRTSDGRALRADTWVGFHTLRHTCATILFRRGWNAVQVQRWLGHSRPSFTLDTYVHLLDEDLPEPIFFDEIVTSAETEAVPHEAADEAAVVHRSTSGSGPNRPGVTKR